MPEPKKAELMMKQNDMDNFLRKSRARLVSKLLSKGLKPDWDERDFIGFISVMASLHSQTKDWKFPSNEMYMTLDPQSLSLLITCLEHKKDE